MKWLRLLPWLVLLPIALLALLLRFQCDLVARAFGWASLLFALPYRWIVLGLVPRWVACREGSDDARRRAALADMLSRARRARRGG